MRWRNVVLLSLVMLLGWVTAPQQSHADRGVGVSSGNIIVHDKLAPGRRYNLPSISVINTGDEPGTYEVILSYLEGQKERRIPEEWVQFDPQSFFLEAGQSQPIGITVTIPLRARPADYFAFIEAHPVIEATGTTVGVAAATRLFFTVRPANLASAVINRVRSFFETYSPEGYIGLGALGGILILFAARRFIRIRIRVERK